MSDTLDDLEKKLDRDDVPVLGRAFGAVMIAKERIRTLQEENAAMRKLIRDAAEDKYDHCDGGCPWCGFPKDARHYPDCVALPFLEKK